MKKQILVGLLTLAMGAAAHAVTIGYSDTPSSTMSFDGAGNFSFSSGDNIQITTGSASGDIGAITGSYTIGSITTVAGVSTATVSGSGTFTIHDGTGHDLSANLTWVDITQVSGAVGLNISGAANLTGITYTGSNADLAALAAGLGLGVNELSLTFNPPVTLTSLDTVPHPGLSFSGTISTVNRAPDGGSTAMLFGSALVGLSVLRRKFGVMTK